MSEGRKAPRDRGAKSPIAEARLAANMTQGQLAEAVGCMQKDISRWERGVYSPRVEVLAMMAEALGCSIGELIKKGQD